MAACSHLSEITTFQPPRLSQSVHREECTQCFDNQDDPAGIDVCLTCFNGGCLGEERHHSRDHFRKSGHPFTLNVKRKAKPAVQRAEGEEPPSKMTKLSIQEDREEDKYDHVTTLRCWKCSDTNGLEVVPSDPDLTKISNSIMQSMSSARQSEVKSWEVEIVPCEHTLTLQQRPIPSIDLKHCAKCELKENLWLCLICGSLGCGRYQYGGTGGNGHGLGHFEETGHGVSVKLGTITPEGSADIHCYICDDSKLDPELALHLSTFNINVATQEKTEKSVTELQIEHNLNFDFSLTSQDGQALEPVFGPGLTGLANLGNSCYMASVLQTLFSLPAFQSRYLPASTHAQKCTVALPADCLECQMSKIADGLLSGRYSYPVSHFPEDSETHTGWQRGLKPTLFKALIGKGHEEFSTMRQQDSEEFFVHLLTTLRRTARAQSPSNSSQEPTEIFAYGMEQRLQCGGCMGVRYRIDESDVVSVPVPAKELGKDGDRKTQWEEVKLVEDCLSMLLGIEEIGYTCEKCRRQVIAHKQSRFATFPEVLIVHAKKFQLVNWVPTKLDIPIALPADDQLTLDAYLGHGLRPNETELPSDRSSSALPVFDEGAMAQLEGMGFPTIRCQKALLATGNNNTEVAMEWLFEHMEDPDIDDPIPTSSAGAAAGPEPSEEQIGMLSDMGFTSLQAKKALRETGGNAERAVEWLFSHPDDTGEENALTGAAPSTSSKPCGSSALPAKYKLKAFISHKGPSVHSGHYVAHIRVDRSWVMFNDEKVMKADEQSVHELKKLAYLYVFEKC